MYHNNPGEVERDHLYIAPQQRDLPRTHFRSIPLLSDSISKYSDRMNALFLVSIPSNCTRIKGHLLRETRLGPKDVVGQ